MVNKLDLGTNLVESASIAWIGSHLTWLLEKIGEEQDFASKQLKSIDGRLKVGADTWVLGMRINCFCHMVNGNPLVFGLSKLKVELFEPLSVLISLIQKDGHLLFVPGSLWMDVHDKQHWTLTNLIDNFLHLQFFIRWVVRQLVRPCGVPSKTVQVGEHFLVSLETPV